MKPGAVGKIQRQRGAALLLAMLTVTLVAALSATVLWQQWQAIEVESAERSRVQASWILTGAVDYARLILIEDARTGGPDHLAEPWAVVLKEARLSSFLAADKNNNSGSADSAPEAFLSGRIEDMQSRLNVSNLIDGDNVSSPDLVAFTRLFSLLGLPPAELSTLAETLRLTTVKGDTTPAGSTVPLTPQHMRELAWLGLTPNTLALLAPYASVLPGRSTINLNTASPEVIYASVPGLEMAQAQTLVDERARSPFRTLEDARRFVGLAADRITEARYSVNTRFFEVRGRLRLDKLVVEERSLLQRDGVDVKTLWREKAALDDT